jgi:hypothetical protein
MYIQKVNKQLNNFWKKLFFVAILKATNEKNRIRIRKSVEWIQIHTEMSRLHKTAGYERGQRCG